MSTETPEAPVKDEPETDPLRDALLKKHDTVVEANKDLTSKLDRFNAVFKANAKKELAASIKELSEAIGDTDDGKKLVKDLKAQLDAAEFTFNEEGEVVKTSLHSEIALHLKYAVKPKKVVEDNKNKIPEGVSTKEPEGDPNDDPKYIPADQLAALIKDMPK